MTATQSDTGSDSEEAILARLDEYREEIARLEAVLRDLRRQSDGDEKTLRELRASCK